MVFSRLESCAGAEVVATQSSKGMAIQIDGSPFTEYLTRSGAKPILWPILGPTDQAMTRAYPMGEIAGETKDHIHQRSLWFTHGDVNGISFWHENAKHGTIVHRRFAEVRSGAEAAFTAENEWIGPDNKKILTDEQRLRFGVEEGIRWIDFDITLKASSGPVKFGDTKEGTFGVRVAESMRVDSKKGGKIVNSQGQTDGAAWGRKAAWVDYHGPVGGQTVGVAIMNHPDSFRFPTFWHVRTYGLFSANPFGQKEFPDGGKQDGSYTLPEGKTLTLRYRVWLHKGDEKEGRVAAAYQSYAGKR
jgi:hypothetical protein